MTAKSTQSARRRRKRTAKPERTLRYERLDDMPKAPPLTKSFRRMSDAEVARRAAADPDAGAVPPGFWDRARVLLPENKRQITLRLDADVIRWFKATGKGYQSRMGAVLRSYVAAKGGRG